MQLNSRHPRLPIPQTTYLPHLEWAPGHLEVIGLIEILLESGAPKRRQTYDWKLPSAQQSITLLRREVSREEADCPDHFAKAFVSLVNGLQWRNIWSRQLSLCHPYPSTTAL
jgi:hypothetical protein